MSSFLSENFRVLQSSSVTTGESTSSSNTTLIIIISCAAGVVLILGVVVVILLLRRKNKKKEEEELKKKQFDEKSVRSVVSKHFRKSLLGDPNTLGTKGLNRFATGATSRKKTTFENKNDEENNEEEPQEERVYEFNPEEEQDEEQENEEKSIEECEIVLKEKPKKINTRKVTFTEDVVDKHEAVKTLEEASKRSRAANEIIAKFTEKLKGLKQKKKQKSILEEIEKMKRKKEKKKAIDNNPTEDRSSVHILNTDISHISQISARSVVKKENHVNIVCYTDENREEPEEAFYNQKLEDLQEEKRQIELEEKEAIKKEKEIEEKFKKQRMSKNLTKDDSNEDYSNLYKYNEQPEEDFYQKKETLKVKSQALMTDFSQPKNVEVLKEAERSSTQS